MPRCDLCLNNQTDEYGESYCHFADSLDEDEYVRLLANPNDSCPFFEGGDEYKIVRKQN